MTPTLLGRWETRFCLLATVGVLIALAVGYGYNLNAGTPFDDLNYVLPLTIMGYVLGFGLLWDVVYQASIYLRWERDWPTTFQVLAGFIEGTLIWLLLHYTTLLPLPHNIPSRNMPFRVYLTLYGVHFSHCPGAAAHLSTALALSGGRMVSQEATGRHTAGTLTNKLMYRGAFVTIFLFTQGGMAWISPCIVTPSGSTRSPFTC